MRLPKIPRDNRPLREALIVGAVSVAGAAIFFSAAFASTWWARALAVMLASLTAIQTVLIFHDAMHESSFRSHHANR